MGGERPCSVLPQVDLAMVDQKPQQSDGSLGGGWGDDVEILRVSGAFVGSVPMRAPW